MMNTEAALNKDMRAGKCTMEHRHFATVATIIREMFVTPDVRHEIAVEFAAGLAGTNPRFDRKRFLKACGVSAS